MNSSVMVPISSGDRAEEGGMDWYAWLSRAGLEPTLAYEYALLFAQNELDQDDIPHLDHGFLLSMGVSVGKHRLQILQLAQRDEGRRRGPGGPVVRLLAAAGRARRCMGRCLRSLAAGGGGGRSVRGGSPAALVAARREMFGGGGAGGGQYWRSAVLRRKKKLALLKQGRLMLTDGGIRVTPGPPPLSPSPRSQSVSPVFYGRRGGSEADDNFWGGAGGEADQEMRWDSMFQDLKPT